MDRRKSIKALLIGSAATGVFVEACKNTDKKITEASSVSPFTGDDRMKEEISYYKKVTADTFFSKHEIATITVLVDIIIPKDELSGSATDAKVPDFLEFIVKDMPQHQTPMRGGLRWLDIQCLKQFDKAFVDCDDKQRIAMVDQIAYPNKAKPGMNQGVAFFSLMRNLTVTGFFTSEIGVKDLDYKGNTPNQWNGVPDDVLKQFNLAYSERELKECVSFSNG